MRLFRLGRDLDLAKGRERWSLHAKRRWGLPGAECPQCFHGGSAFGHAYPSVDLSGLHQEREYRKARLAPWDEYVRLRDLVRPLLPAGVPLLPSLDMGPLVGAVRGRPPPVVLEPAWTLLVQPEAVERLLAAGLRGINPQHTALKVGRDVPPMFELELVAGGDYAPEIRPAPVGAPCPLCSTQPTTARPSPWWLDSASQPNADVFRFREVPAAIIATERFVEVVRSMGGDIRFKATELAPPAARETGASL
ncbi:double-CXXCG motif protein [Myxococcus sp. K15C18031901]|uniref:SitI6 family double-CXXCG motif immunity protein n=1 Tax=Myxococcus dinghuensis TaxID=2906761 RepID=UPI0020A76EC2|nr:double-CXXCG motif protein [Myxococcus dinghuensis]MCP3105569.1 double-CXXCG motif protein [Myxococcus dinghuensis]